MKMRGMKHYRHIVSEDGEHDLFIDHGGLIVAEQIAENLLPYAVVNNPNYTFHDLDHSFRVCDNINEILDRFPPESFSALEIELLYQAALLHDIGMVFLPRDKEPRLGISHSELSAFILRQIRSKGYMNDGFSNLGSQEHVNALATIVESHGMSIDRFDMIADIVEVDWESVALKRLSAALSLADGLELGSQRISVTAFDILTDRELMASLADEIGTQSIPFLGRVSREHWMREKDTRVNFVDNENIVISVGSAETGSELDELVRYMRHYISVLDLDLKIDVVESDYEPV